MTMRRREFLQASGSAIAAAALGGCVKTPRSRLNIASLRDPMAALVAAPGTPGEEDGSLSRC